MRKYVRLGNITYSRDFVKNTRAYGFILTRKNTIIHNGVMINHGNREPYKLGRKVNRFYWLNQPDYLNNCSNKMKNFNMLNEFYPFTTRSTDEARKHINVGNEIIAKPVAGHHGYGIKFIHNENEMDNFMRNKKGNFVYQELLPIKHEYRFNIFDKEIFQVSRKVYTDKKTPKGGFVFEWKSLGAEAKISQKFWEWVNVVMNEFHKTVKDNIGTYCIDVIKSKGKYYLCEMNVGYGIGEFTASKLNDLINNKLENGELEKYRIR
jgi:glutathione synthase/RimK-type ligase-like ATP-grasp enzyme